jgi:hypothetical protein
MPKMKCAAFPRRHGQHSIAAPQGVNTPILIEIIGGRDAAAHFFRDGGCRLAGATR